MKYVGRFFAVSIFIAAILASCDTGRDAAVYRELLVETEWSYRAVDQAGYETEYIYDFNTDGILDIYRVQGIQAVPEIKHRYIYDAEKYIIAIEALGAFDVTEINVDHLVFEGDDFNMEFTRYTGDAVITE